jgi:hypothetical protein
MGSIRPSIGKENNMDLGDLSLSARKTTENVKVELENRLSSILPPGSFTIIIRSYQGDFRARNTNQPNYNAMILLDTAGRKTALARKNEIEALGFKVSAAGDINLN